VLIANKEVSTNSLETRTLKRIYLGLHTRWSDNQKIVPVMLDGGETHEAFVKEMLNKTVSKFVIYWKQALFSGRGVPPKSFSNEKELIKFVASTPGAMGYISGNTVPVNVKILSLE